MPGIKTVTSIRIGAVTLLGVLAGVQVIHQAPAIEVPSGFDARIYARDIAGARDLRVGTDGTLTLRGDSASFEITPPRDDSPRMVMRVARELDRDAVVQATALAAPMAPEVPITDVRVLPETLALARALARQSFTDVALAPDGTLYVSDARAGVVYQVRRITL
jgi:hypothetical protein